MSADEGVNRKRRITPPVLPPGPLKELKEALYGLYLSADAPSVKRIHDRIRELADGDEASDPTATPVQDTVHKVLASPTFPPNVCHVVAVAAALLFPRHVDGVVPEVGDNPTVKKIRQLWEDAALHRPPGRLVTDTLAVDLGSVEPCRRGRVIQGCCPPTSPVRTTGFCANWPPLRWTRMLRVPASRCWSAIRPRARRAPCTKFCTTLFSQQGAPRGDDRAAWPRLGGGSGRPGPACPPGRFSTNSPWSAHARCSGLTRPSAT